MPVRVAVAVALQQALRHGDREVAAAALPGLRRGLVDPHAHPRINAARGVALAKVHVGADAVAPLAPALRTALADPVWSVRWRAADVLARLPGADFAALDAALAHSAPRPGTHDDTAAPWLRACSALPERSPELRVCVVALCMEGSDDLRAWVRAIGL